MLSAERPGWIARRFPGCSQRPWPSAPPLPPSPPCARSLPSGRGPWKRWAPPDSPDPQAEKRVSWGLGSFYCSGADSQRGSRPARWASPSSRAAWPPTPKRPWRCAQWRDGHGRVGEHRLPSRAPPKARRPGAAAENPAKDGAPQKGWRHWVCAPGLRPQRPRIPFLSLGRQVTTARAMARVQNGERQRPALPTLDLSPSPLPPKTALSGSERLAVRAPQLFLPLRRPAPLTPVSGVTLFITSSLRPGTRPGPTGNWKGRGRPRNALAQKRLLGHTPDQNK